MCYSNSLISSLGFSIIKINVLNRSAINARLSISYSQGRGGGGGSSLRSAFLGGLVVGNLLITCRSSGVGTSFLGNFVLISSLLFLLVCEAYG